MTAGLAIDDANAKWKWTDSQAAMPASITVVDCLENLRDLLFRAGLFRAASETQSSDFLVGKPGIRMQQ